MNIVLLAGELDLSDDAVYALVLGRGLVGRGHDVRLLSGEGSLSALLTEDTLTDVRHRLRGPLWRDVVELQRLTRTLEPFRAQVLHVTSEQMDGAGFHLARRLRVPRIVTFHGREPHLLSRWRQPDLVLVPAQAQRAIAVRGGRLPGARVRVVPYGLPAAPAPPPPDKGGGRAAAGTAGPLRRGRGLKQFVRAMGRVAKRHPGALFPVVGAGPYRRFLIRHAEEQGLRDRVVITESCAEPRLLLSGFDVVVFPSVDEEFGCLALLAMSLGRPIVASAVGHAFDLVEDGVTGYLVPPRDEEALADRVLHLLDHPEEAAALGDRARQHARRFSLEAMITGTAAAYRSLPAAATATSSRRA